jgi:hypothetical protein
MLRPGGNHSKGSVPFQFTEAPCRTIPQSHSPVTVHACVSATSVFADTWMRAARASATPGRGLPATVCGCNARAAGLASLSMTGTGPHPPLRQPPVWSPSYRILPDKGGTGEGTELGWAADTDGQADELVLFGKLVIVQQVEPTHAGARAAANGMRKSFVCFAHTSPT